MKSKKSKKILLIVIFAVLGAAIVVTVFAIGYRNRKTKAPEPERIDTGKVVEFESLEEAAAHAGFSMACPDRLNGMPATEYSADKTTITVKFGGVGYITKTLVPDETRDSEAEENTENAGSGESLELNGMSVAFIGDDDTVTRAVWTDNSFDYVICLTDGSTTTDVMTEYVLETR